MKPKLLFIDRDGTLIKEPPVSFQVNSLEELEFLPGVIGALSNIVQQGVYELVMVTNQDGLGTDANPLDNFEKVQHKLLQVLAGEGIAFKGIHIDDSYPEEQKETRKPGTAMLQEYLSGDYDIAGSFVIGDRLTDVALAHNLGCSAVLILNNEPPDGNTFPVALATDNWQAITSFLLRQQRIVSLERRTAETDIRIRLNPDGTGKGIIHTGLGFFDHMLAQLARHGGFDLDIHVVGDLQVDEHHTVEDTGIALGMAFARALADKRGMERYGFCLPMDDCLAQVAIDFGGRSWIVWDAIFQRERIGDMPTELFFHFFKSFSDTALCNLNIKAEGTNEHHKIESIFKAWARAIRQAVRNDGTDILPSTKGVL